MKSVFHFVHDFDFVFCSNFEGNIQFLFATPYGSVKRTITYIKLDAGLRSPVCNYLSFAGAIIHSIVDNCTILP